MPGSPHSVAQTHHNRRFTSRAIHRQEEKENTGYKPQRFELSVGSSRACVRSGNFSIRCVADILLIRLHRHRYSHATRENDHPVSLKNAGSSRRKSSDFRSTEVCDRRSTNCFAWVPKDKDSTRGQFSRAYGGSTTFAVRRKWPATPEGSSTLRHGPGSKYCPTAIGQRG